MSESMDKKNSGEALQELRAIFHKLVKIESSSNKQSGRCLGGYKSSISYNANSHSFKSSDVKSYMQEEAFKEFVEYCTKMTLTWQKLLDIIDEFIKEEAPINEQSENGLEQNKSSINEQSENNLETYKSSIIYNIDLYTFNSYNIPFYINDKDFDNSFRIFRNIFVTKPDSKHIEEIRTGIILPIVDLDNVYFSGDNYSINYNTDSDDNYALFAISYNKILKANKMDLNKLLDYYKEEKDDIENLIKCKQMNIINIPEKSKMLKK